MNEQLVEEFAELFQGREDAYGTGEGRCVRQPLTFVQYHAHLAGHGAGLGVYPLRDDGTVRFAAIDLDEPDFDFVRGLQPMLPGPTWIERSRSGNAHLLVFFAAPCPAWIVRGILRATLEAVGRPDVEVFPKQDALKEGGLGNYLNLAYHGDSRPVLQEGRAIALPTFVREAHATSNDPERWRDRTISMHLLPPDQRKPLAEFGERETVHRCAMHIYENRESNPIQAGHRHSVYLALAKMLLNFKPLSTETARRMVHEVNDASAAPAPPADVDQIVDSVLEREYTSTGCDDPLVQPYADPTCGIAYG